MEDRRCKLGLQGRRELVGLIEEGDCASVVAPLACGLGGRAAVAGLLAEPAADAAVLSLVAVRGC